MFAQPKTQPALNLDPAIAAAEVAAIRDNLSALCFAAGHLWLGGDEGLLIDRFTPLADGGFGHHRRFDLGPLLGMAPGTKGEIDIEGLDFDGGFLWLTGSHSLKRKKAEEDKPDDKNRDRLAKVDAREESRQTLARLTLNADAEPVSAARLERVNGVSLLYQSIAADPHLSRFTEIPSKDNGIDIEGLAVRGQRVFVGLRGPVLRGWAIILEAAWKPSAGGASSSLQLDGPVKKHFLQLNGLGIRDLAFDGPDLIVLAGPSMDLDGPVRLYRWSKALEQNGEAVVWRSGLQRLIEVGHGFGESEGRDHAEGVALIRETQNAGLEALVCFDSPSPARLDPANPHRVRLDRFALEA